MTRLVPDASHYYSWFPPESKAEPEKPWIPDIFDPDCRTSSPEVSDTHLPNKGGVAGSHVDLVPGESSLNSEVDIPYQLAGHDRSFDPDMDAAPQDTQDTQDTDGHDEDFWNIAATLDASTNLETVPPPQQTMTPAEFLQLALVEALGGGEYFDDDDEYESDIFDDEEMGDVQTQGEEQQEPPIGMENNQDYAIPSAGITAYYIFERMFRAIYPNDPVPFGPMETLMAHGKPPAATPPIFPILHFSLTDIRLIPAPFATHPSVFCGAPLRQPFSQHITSLRGPDRLNMVQQIPELGLVIAASQKGRAAVISITESELTGVAFRVDWIVPFESQEKYGERPLRNLLGMTVSPIQGFEFPPDPPYIEREAGYRSNLDFYFDIVARDEAESSPGSPADSNQEPRTPAETTCLPIHPQDKNTPSKPHTVKSVPQRHASMNQTWHPEEPWRGWNPGRRYRLVMMYDDHTVMTYEFWYDRKPKGKGDDESMEVDPFLDI